VLENLLFKISTLWCQNERLPPTDAQIIISQWIKGCMVVRQYRWEIEAWETAAGIYKYVL
jgi:hypothetical protein